MNSQWILVTGGAGFIGSNFVPYFLDKYPGYSIVNIDKLTYAGNMNNLTDVKDTDRYEFIKGDICNRELINYIFDKYNISGVIHFAAESHVDNSINGPDIFIETNVKGTFTVLDVAREHWMNGPFKHKPKHLESRFLHISTDEVYGSLDANGYFTEQTPYAPNSPYSASKASADMIVRSFFHTYGMNVVTTNCSNNYGPKQHSEKLIPTIIRNALSFNPIPIYGDGKNVRDWLYVLDHCKAIDLVFHRGVLGQTYNIGGNNERNNLYIVNAICEILDNLVPRESIGTVNSYKELITFVRDRPGHDLRYAIDTSKICSELDWSPEESFESGLENTVKWYLDYFHSVHQGDKI